MIDPPSASRTPLIRSCLSGEGVGWRRRDASSRPSSNAKRRPAGEQRPATDAGRGRARDPALDAEAVARHAERALPRPRPAGSTGSAPPSPVASPSDQAAEIARLRRELDRTAWERDVLKSHRHLRGDAQVTLPSSSSMRGPGRCVSCAACSESHPALLRMAGHGLRAPARPPTANSWTTSGASIAAHHRATAPARACRPAGRGPVCQPRTGGAPHAPARHPCFGGASVPPCTTDSRHDLPIAPNLLKQTSRPRGQTRSGWPI